MQKLITIYISSDRDNEVEEHLESYLSDGWEVVKLCPIGTYSPGSFSSTAGFLSVVLEK